jgi:IMP dehydrogenase
VKEIELAPGKRARSAYSFDDIAIVPSRRTRDPENVSTNWQIDAYKFALPMMAAPMDSVVSPETAIEIGRLGGLGVLNLEGLWTRYEDPRIPLGEIASMPDKNATKRMQEIYNEPIKPALIKARIAQIRDAGVTVAASLSPARTAELHKAVIDAGVDIFVIRGTTVSAEHVAAEDEALNLKKFIYELDVPVIVGGVATATAALHLMRAGAAGVLVGFGGGAAHTTRKVLGIEVPMASAVAEVASARREYLDESGGRYVHVIADGAVGRSGDIAKAIACGADAVMMGSPLAKATEAPGLGWHWGSEAHHQVLPRGERVNVGTVGTLEECNGYMWLFRCEGVPARRGTYSPCLMIAAYL